MSEVGVPGEGSWDWDVAVKLKRLRAKESKPKSRKPRKKAKTFKAPSSALTGTFSRGREKGWDCAVFFYQWAC